jgi:hypothetical protein
MPPSEGIPLSTSLLASNTSGAPRESGSSPGLVWARPQLSLTPLLEGSCRTPVEGRFSIPRGLYWAQSPLSIHLEISVRGSPSGPFEARLFRRRSENGAVVGGVARRLRSEQRTRALTCGFRGSG